MQKAYKLLMAATVVSMTVGFNHAVAAKKDTYQVVSTSYQQPITTFETYVGNKKIETVRYAFGNAQYINDGLMYGSETNRVVDLKNSKQTVKRLTPAPGQIRKYKDAYYVMSLEDVDHSSLTKYTLDFKKIGQTKKFSGYGRHLILMGDKVYVLADHMKGYNYSIKLHTFDTKSFAALHHETITSMLFTYHMRQAGSQLKIYGIRSEKDEKMTVLSYDVEKQRHTKTMTTDQHVKGGLEKTQTLSKETELIFNRDRMYEINHRTKQVRVLYDSKDDLVDYAYDAKTKTYHVLEENTKTAEFRVKTLNSHFKPIAEYRLKKSDSVSPFRVL
ncbi:hypothetical protein QK289_15115 [Exiguobacterium antarcticum]|uniref:Uncharacterized protein n=1 Tax=Exiguobacterium antarcticum TaxID=132920 RepID=A0ABT6R6A9_9BACL|nr:hypothetical protein [Exiguobacterium antarcticum]MDI3236343.1 hypothetical protein [Exiguobacterium antarcticum]